MLSFASFDHLIFILSLYILALSFTLSPLSSPFSHFQDQHLHDSHYYAQSHPSPPPIATLTHSPSLSSDRSSVNSPAPTILPPLNHPSQFQPQQYVTTGAHRYSASAQPGAYHHPHYYPNTVSPPEVFNTPAQGYAHAYGGGYAPPPPPTHIPFHHSPDMSQYSVNPYATTSGMYGHAGHGGGSGGFTPIYTDDASTKLSDRVRRRCFNCCTTDTSTWRRSSLNPGKVVRAFSFLTRSFLAIWGFSARTSAFAFCFRNE